MKTITYEGIQHGDWVKCTQCGAQMLLPCGAVTIRFDNDR